MNGISLFKDKDFGSYIASVQNKNSFDALDKITASEFAKPDFTIETKARETAKTNEISLLTFDDLQNPSKDIKMMTTVGRREDAVVEYTFKFQGDSNLLSVVPYGYTYQGRAILAQIFDNEVKFTINTEYGSIKLSDSVIKDVLVKKNQLIDIIEKSLEALNTQIKQYNIALYEIALQRLKARKSEIDTQNDILNKL